MLFVNAKEKFYMDEGNLIGFPDRHEGRHLIAQTIHQSLVDKDLLSFVREYEFKCEKFVSVFSDGGFLKNLLECIGFGMNDYNGWAFSLGINNYEDLFSPFDLSKLDQ